MPGDYSRFTDDPKKHFAKVLMQQGKVQLDADWNEMVDIVVRGERLQAVDTFGPIAVPRFTTPNAFLITQGLRQTSGPIVATTSTDQTARTTLTGSFGGPVFVKDLQIGAGRCYV